MPPTAGARSATTKTSTRAPIPRRSSPSSTAASRSSSMSSARRTSSASSRSRPTSRKLRLILFGAREGWSVADRIAAAHVPVITIRDRRPARFVRDARLDQVERRPPGRGGRRRRARHVGGRIDQPAAQRHPVRRQPRRPGAAARRRRRDARPGARADHAQPGRDLRHDRHRHDRGGQARRPRRLGRRPARARVGPGRGA